MRVIKLYQLKERKTGINHQLSKPKYDADKPEYYHLVRSDMFKSIQGKHGYALLVNYPIDKPNSKREAMWLYTDEVYIEWVKTFCFEGMIDERATDIEGVHDGL